MDKSGALIESLLTKSQEAFIVGIELYNKPTIRYRVEGFSFFICNAWELMLKAYLVKRNGSNSIYYSNDLTRTISLTNCIEKVFTNNKDPLRMNLERIIELRNTSTHFITEEYEQIYVPFFQSCILNYVNKLLEFFDVDITRKLANNFLTLSVKLDPIDPAVIQARYTKQIAEHLLSVQKRISDTIPTDGNSKYAILIKHDFYITKKEELATAKIAISKDSSQSAFILKETRDMQKVCPYNRKKCLEIISHRLKKKHINFINPSLDPSDAKYHTFNSNHFNLIVEFYNIKSNPKYCYIYENGTNPLYKYSEAAINFIVSEIEKDPEQIIQKLRHQLHSNNKKASQPQGQRNSKH